jgi:hypothetical protein
MPSSYCESNKSLLKTIELIVKPLWILTSLIGTLISINITKQKDELLLSYKIIMCLKWLK